MQLLHQVIAIVIKSLLLLANISEAKETAALEAKITKIINDAGFKNAFVEVENKND